jgi:uncharacterized surface protein with fasciclin (FAS1) repeats
MKTSLLHRTGAVAALAVTLSLGLAACGDDNDDNAATTSDPTASETTDAGMDDAGADTFGEGCSAIPADGKGSFNGMATDPVATAASNNPLLKTLVSAVGVAGLGDTLNTAEAITVFAPTDEAFAKIPKKDLDAVLADKALLTKILTHHVVAGKLSPDQVAGEQKTLAGDTITVEGDAAQGVTVGTAGGPAKVLCGNIPTANATVYVIDTVLMPAA